MRHFGILTLLLAGIVSANAGTTVKPTTTLAAETGNNTSAANTFATLSNGDITPGNVSKVSIKTVVPFAGKTFVHFQPWFGRKNHMMVGYASDDSTQVAAQVADMMSRGFDGAIVYFSGSDRQPNNNATLMLRDESLKQNGKFQFAISEDSSSLSTCANTSGCDVTQELINDLIYIYNNYESASSYLRYNGRPVVFFFGIEQISGINWTRVTASVPGNPIYLWRNSSGFTRPLSGGAYSWLGINSDPTQPGTNYLDGYYKTALSYSTMLSLGSAWKGFDDSLASWGKNRLVYQNCGQTWLASLNTMNKYYSISKPAYALQIATWNDYEEGTEIETGIDNCVSISAGVNGNMLSWSITGQENTLDHYTVFISLDGANLMPLANLATGVHSLDLLQYGLAPASYTLYVKAVGKPSLLNHMSNAISFRIANQPPVAKLSVTPTSGIAPVSVTADASSSSDSDGSVQSTVIDFGDGTKIAASTAAHTYSSEGTYIVTATVTDNLGAVASAKQTITISANQTPIAKLSVTPASCESSVVVTASTAASYDNDGSITKSTISWGDGMMTTSATGSHTYSAAGNFTVTGTVTDDRGATSSANATVTVTKPNQIPIAKLTVTPSNGIAPVTVSASTVGSSDPDGSIASTTINWGDGTSSNATSGSHNYTKAGSYTIAATVTDNKGATASATGTVMVDWGVKVLTPASGITTSSPVRFTATATGAQAITAMKIYVDTVSSYLVNAASLDTSLSMSKGTHNVTVQAWDAAGSVYKTKLVIAVQ